MSGQAYVGTRKRSFRNALLRLLENDFQLVGCRRVLEMLAEDIAHLIQEFYPVPEHLSPGWMVFTGTRASGSRAYPGQSAADHPLVTLAWPVLTPEDIEQLTRIGDSLSLIHI